MSNAPFQLIIVNIIILFTARHLSHLIDFSYDESTENLLNYFVQNLIDTDKSVTNFIIIFIV